MLIGEVFKQSLATLVWGSMFSSPVNVIYFASNRVSTNSKVWKMLNLCFQVWEYHSLEKMLDFSNIAKVLICTVTKVDKKSFSIWT